MSAPRGVPLHAGGPGKPTSTIRCCAGIRNTVALLSALVTVVVPLVAGGMISRFGLAVAVGMAIVLHAGIGGGTGDADWVGFAVGGGVAVGSCAHPAASTMTARPSMGARKMAILMWPHDINARHDGVVPDFDA